VSKTNALISALDRHAHRINLDLVERGNVRCFEYGPTRRWLEYRPGGAGIVKVTAYSSRGGNVEAVQHKTQTEMEKLMLRALEPFVNQED
jgi:hypothetical protein